MRTKELREKKKPLAIQASSTYEFVGKSIYFPHCLVMKESGKDSAPHFIVPEDKVQDISSINIESDAAFS